MTTKTLLMVVAIAALMSVSAAAEDAVVIKAQVPFDFMIGDQRVPAGEYTFAQDPLRGPMRISSWDTGTAVAVLYHSAGDNRTGFPYALVFNKFGNQHFLKQIWAGQGRMGVQLPASRAEKEEMARHAPTKTTLTASLAR